MALEPITRQEKIISGENLKPITRMERFLKEFGGSGGGVSPEEVTTIVKEQFPGGVGYSKMVEIVPETSATTVEYMFTFMATFDFTGLFIDGNTYIVNFNGEQYICIAAGDYVGNAQIMQPWLPEGSGDPFCLNSNGIATSVAMDVNFSVREIVTNKLNSEFIPNDVPKYGKAGELMVFEWDGNTAGLDTFVDNGIPFYKVSDVVIPVEHIVSLNSERSDGETGDTFNPTPYGCIVGPYNAAIVTNAENNNIPSNGVYFRYTADNGIRCLRVEIDTRRENTILYLNSPSGVKYAITVDDNGTLTATAI